MPPRRRTATSTSNFGVGRRESHVADAFYARFEAPELSADEHVTAHEPGISCVCGDARRMDAVADDSVALVVTSPPYFAGKQYEEELDREGVPGLLHRVPGAAARRVRRVQAGARAGRPHRGQRGQPRAQAVPQPGRRRHGHPAGRPAPAAPGRDRVAEGRGRQRLVRLGLLPLGGQPGAARRDRARHRGQQGPLRPGPQPQGAPARRPAPREQHRRRRLHGPDARRVGHPARERAARAAPRPVPRRAAAAADGALHVSRRSRGRPVLRVGLDAGGGGRAAGATPSATTSTPPTSSCPWPAWRAEGGRPDGTAAATARRRRRWPGPPSRPPASPTCGPTAACAGSGLAVDFTAADAGGRTWYFDVAGPNSAYRGGMARSETVWRALGRAHVHGRRRGRPLRRAHHPAPPVGHRGRPGPAGPGSGRDLRRRRPPGRRRTGAARRPTPAGRTRAPLPGFWADADVAPGSV